MNADLPEHCFVLVLEISPHRRLDSKPFKVERFSLGHTLVSQSTQFSHVSFSSNQQLLQVFIVKNEDEDGIPLILNQLY